MPHWFFALLACVALLAPTGFPLRFNLSSSARPAVLVSATSKHGWTSSRRAGTTLALSSSASSMAGQASHATLTCVAPMYIGAGPHGVSASLQLVQQCLSNSARPRTTKSAPARAGALLKTQPYFRLRRIAAVTRAVCDAEPTAERRSAAAPSSRAREPGRHGTLYSR